jgi:4-amino-4-deoxy-L-arabinose transferase-like glycosyltransferase
VTQTNNALSNGSTSPGTSLTPVARIVWILLIIATLYLCYFHNLGAIGLVGPDEPRYAWIARDMAESGDWVTPRLYGQPWFEKPVLYYWGAALSFKLFGVSEAAARLPSALCALLANLSMAWLARRIYGVETARWLLLLLPTTIGMIGFSHAAATDMPFSGMLTVAMAFAAVIVGLTRDEHSPILPRTPWLALLFFGLFLGLAVLAKGPAAIILSGSAVLLWAAFTRRWRDAIRCLHPVAVASFCLTALPWYILCSLRNPDFFRVFIIEHNFKRFLTPEFQHIQPFWYYLPIILIAFLPWMPALLSTTGFGLLRFTRGQRFSAHTLFLLCWSLFCLLFFSISKSKLPGYILPAIPAIGLLLAWSYVQLASRKGRVFRWIQLGIGTLWVLLGIAITPLHFRGATAAGLVIAAFGLANILLGLYLTRSIGAIPISSFSVVPVLLLLCFFTPLSSHFFSGDPSGKTLASDIMASQIPLDQIYIRNMNRGQQFSLSYYLHHETQQWNPVDPKEGFLLLNARNCAHFVQPAFVCSQDPILSPSGWFLYQITRQQ